MKADISKIKAILRQSEMFEHDLVSNYGANAGEARLFIAALSVMGRRLASNPKAAEIEKRKLDKAISEWSQSSKDGKEKMLNMLFKIFNTSDGAGPTAAVERRGSTARRGRNHKNYFCYYYLIT